VGSFFSNSLSSGKPNLFEIKEKINPPFVPAHTKQGKKNNSN